MRLEAEREIEASERERERANALSGFDSHRGSKPVDDDDCDDVSAEFGGGYDVLIHGGGDPDDAALMKVLGKP